MRLADEAATTALGARLGRALGRLADPAASRRAEGPLAVIHLRGTLGAGKTTVARGAIRALGHTGPVRSPTFTLVEPYPFAALTIVHLDLYRLADPEELELLGGRDLLEPDIAWLVEWPERGAGFVPAPDLTITLETEPEGRRATFTASGGIGALLEAGCVSNS